MKVIIKSTEIKDSEFREYFARSLESVVGLLGDGLELSGLDAVIFTDDFYNDLLKVQEEYGLEKGVTKNTKEAACGKVIRKGIKSYEIYLRIEIAYIYIQSRIINRSLNAYLIRHELGHIHDNNNVGEIIQRIKPRILNNDLYTAAILWGEYMACFLSACAYPLELNYNLSIVKDSYDSCKAKVKQAIDQYKSDHNSMSLYNNVHPAVSTFAIMLCYSFGFSDGDNCTSITNLLEECLGLDQKVENFMEMHDQLNKLRRKYPKWESENTLYLLFRKYCSIWQDFGVSYTVINGEAFIGVRTFN